MEGNVKSWRVSITHNDERDSRAVVSRAMTNIGYCMRQYLSLINFVVYSDCLSFLALILGFIQDHRDPRIPFVPAASLGEVLFICFIFGLIWFDKI